MGDIVANQLEVAPVLQMLDIGDLAGEEVVHTDHILPGGHEPVAEV